MPWLQDLYRCCRLLGRPGPWRVKERSGCLFRDVCSSPEARTVTSKDAMAMERTIVTCGKCIVKNSQG